MESHRLSRVVRWAGFLFLVDSLIVWVSFGAGMLIRFGELPGEKIWSYIPGVALASLILPGILYIGGLYSARSHKDHWLGQLRLLILGFVGVILAITVMDSVDFSSRVGRGVLAGALPILGGLIIVRHLLILKRRKFRYRTCLCLISNEAEEQIYEKLCGGWGSEAKTFAAIVSSDYAAECKVPVLGRIEDVFMLNRLIDLDGVLVRERHFANPAIAVVLRILRYKGVEVIPLSNVCEDTYHAVPLDLITDEWLFRSANQSQLLYIRKLKRLSDIVLASIFMIVLSPFLALGALIVWCSSPGPLIFRQERVGRLGRTITVLKLRTMHVAPKGSKARWATEEKSRIFPMGGILRKFRVDEIPQLINVLKGDMSFVGPRPEQVSIVKDLEKVIPYYRDRLMVQPGITGWAQVRYPYGASVEDAARKLEYDLYYMKHMGVFFDCIILLETVKTILCGGVRRGGDIEYFRFLEDLDKFRAEQGLEGVVHSPDLVGATAQPESEVSASVA